jgi:type II secretory pathway component PulK
MKARAGVALMLVLWIIVILGTICSGVVLATRSTTDIAGNYRSRVVARYAAESGVAVAVAALEERLASLTDEARRRDYLNHMDRALGNRTQLSLGDARVGIALVDVGARLDVNMADGAALARLFSYFTDEIEAENAGRAIRAFIGGIDLTRPDVDTITLQVARPLRSLDELKRVPGISWQLLEKASEYLTVDGDGTINRATASDTVLATAGGDLRDEPSRILVVSRGWQDGHALTHEIQAVYAIMGNELTLVRWRERDL